MPSDCLSEEDKALFRKALGDVTPLKKTQSLVPKPMPRPSSVPRKKAPEPEAKSDLSLSDSYAQEVHSDSILSYGEQNIPHRRMRQLKKGHIAWQARLDLHGLRIDAARQTLWDFIDTENRKEHRCLLIIHGKGSLRFEAPVLKNHVNHWLRQLPHVLAFHSALARDGGSGAVYVLLKNTHNSSSE